VPHHRCRQPGPARELFHYCIALLMVEAGKARLVETTPGEAGQVCVFPRRGPMGETVAGEQFGLARPALSQEAEAEVREIVREILGEEGGYDLF
jgi:hypothetical protein